ncbi:MAG: zinc ribbon domain-containing protein [Halobacteriales archaeon]|nr:zinc ribbon domain-containing protein [Halobacteriales archaeon]
MSELTQRRPWLAAILAVLAPGTGHVYLGRWSRALAWLLAGYAVSILFVSATAGDALLAGRWPGVEPLAPLLAVIGVSAVDAFVLANVHNQLQPRSATDSCPACGGELDANLDFCPWCTLEFDQLDVAEADA